MNYDNLADLLEHTADSLIECDNVTDARAYIGRGDVEIRVSIPNAGWGLPSEVHDAIRGSELHIDDLSHISHDGTVRLYLQPSE